MACDRYHGANQMDDKKSKGQQMQFERTQHGVRCHIRNVTAYALDLTWYGADILRVRATRDTDSPAHPSMVVTADPDSGFDWNISEGRRGLRLNGPGLVASVDEDGHVTFERDGRQLIEEAGRSFPANELPNPEDRAGAEQAFVVGSSDAVYGLGQYQDGVMNWRGHDVTLIHGNVTVAVPFLLSTGGWGILWDNTSHTTFHDGDDGMRLWSEVADGVDYYLCSGPDTDAAVAGYRHLSGAAPLFPREFYGFIQCKERYCTADELTEVVHEHRCRRLPLDVIVQDWRYWGDPSQWSSMRHDPDTYGDLPGAIKAIHSMHTKVMISIWPVIGVEADLAKELDAGGYLFPAIHWSSGRIYDAFDEEARAIYWRHAKEGLFDHGVDAWWMDGTEPEFAECHIPEVHKAALVAQRDTAAGSWARVLNAFSLQTTKGVYEGQRAATSDKRVFILTRSAFAGQQRYASATWSGDISASWKTFVRQIPAGLNFCASGIPYWTTDNGAFFVRGRGATFARGVDDPAFREFFLRWFQYSCFCPLMRSHGTQTPREIWQFGEPGDVIYDALADFARLRMRLLPYSYSLAADCTFRGGTQMRPLAMDFPHDPRTHAIADQFMYGPALMPCPVTEPMVHMPTDSLEPIPGGEMKVGDEKGSTMRTFDGIDSQTPVMEQHHRWAIDHSWTGNNPEGVTSDSYRVEFDSSLRIAAQGPDTLIVRAAGLVRVELDGERIIDDWHDSPARDLRVPVERGAERHVRLHVEYGHIAGDAVIQLGWELPLDLPPRDADAALERMVYLPAGKWHDFWTGNTHEGPDIKPFASPLELMPLLVRAGSILPLGPEKEWQNQLPDSDMELRIYAGADGHFTLYEDAGDGYAYEDGVYAEIDFSWNDGEKSLTISERRGSFPGMLATRQFHVVLVRPGHGIGIEQTQQTDQTVVYDGCTIRVVLD